MNIEKLHQLFLERNGISTDSRNCPANSLFFALKGDNFNGNLFAQQALESGASYAIVDQADCVKDDKCILVDNVLESLQNLAAFHRKYLNIPIIGITGTNGKTTTKELIYTVLSKKYTTVCTKGNLNNHIGVPLTLLQMSKQTEIGIVEMGANNLNEIAFLCNIARPDYGIITNIGKAHLQGFGSYEGVKKTKKELYDFIKQNNGTVFINSDDTVLTEIAQGLKQIAYGTNSEQAFYSGTIHDENMLVSLHCTIGDETFEIQSQLFGTYNGYNILAAACIGFYFGVSTLEIKQAIEQYTPNNNRSQLHKTGSNTLFLDAYNANPSSMFASVSNFAKLQIPDKILILGEMYELGNDQIAEHKKIVDLLKTFPDLKSVYLVGNWGEKQGNFSYFENVNGLSEHFQNNKPLNCNILIKGSRGVKLEQVITSL
ncbi:MAG: UDP-N-acetylmuramoyl-tripeptide--D-alanyl-D-alanine ligase [Bacteroidales bacterium]|nr:UDP-N-acetylmuramoyl-tripeptide--D-alanyl-D-alanine ligase [Bacteroidales bacterium]